MRRLLLPIAILGAFLLAAAYPVPAGSQPPKPVLVGFDAEIGHKTSSSDEAIRLGIELAIAEINAAGGVLDGRPLQLKVLDNRSVPARGLANMRQFATMDDLVAVYCGKFSPVVIEELPLIHEQKIILLDPWAAADMITSHDHHPSYTFRVSLRDSWAQPLLIDWLATQKVRKIGLLLPNTAWGRSNLYGAEAYVRNHPELKLVTPQWYNWGDKNLLEPYQHLRDAGAEGLVMVANEAEGSLLVREMATLPAEQRMPVSAAWGISGGDFSALSGPALKQVNLAVVQSFSLAHSADTPRGKAVLEALRQRGYASWRQLLSPVGFGHAYDLTHLLALAINQAGSTDREKIRDALEHLPAWQGLVRRYAPPFTPERHDALEPSDLFMARFADDGALVPIANKPR